MINIWINPNQYIKENEYFVLGDNRDVSKDSRMLGNFNEKDIEDLIKLAKKEGVITTELTSLFHIVP